MERRRAPRGPPLNDDEGNLLTSIFTAKGVRAETLAALLRALPASGVRSFENLVRDLLSRTTGRRFTIAKSGPQGGIDARTPHKPDATVIALEAKRYLPTTRLPLDELKSKVRDTASTYPDLDLWLLVASKEIKEPDPGSLRSVGHELGVEVLILDWPESPEVLPALLLLSAAHPDVVESYGLATPDVTRLLEAVRKSAGYGAQLSDLWTRLHRPELGYGNARKAMSDRIRENMASMTAAAARMGRYTNLTDPSIVRIDRPAVSAAINGWWEAPVPRPILALLGNEGMGKTWAALSWWLDHELADNPLPLTLIVPAGAISSADPDELIGRALCGVFRTRDAALWAKRARRWCSDASETRMILILDG